MKKSILLFVGIAIASFGFQSCGEAPQEPAAATEAPAAEPTPAADPAQAAVEQLAAFYTGTLPCADCEGIQTMLTLNADPQRSYTLEEQYKGKSPKSFNSEGTWAVEGNTVTLNGKDGSVKYQVTTDGLVAMNADGTAMDASKYLLKKVQGE
ncbi:MAG: copper resistance protein NlpE N-terminal domain-containing protein [Saprospiraceae bacterium]|nr:copper resistance protein NlpE N-terminal domain-containing protein [Saprospiraceae bacterium]